MLVGVAIFTQCITVVNADNTKTTFVKNYIDYGEKESSDLSDYGFYLTSSSSKTLGNTMRFIDRKQIIFDDSLKQNIFRYTVKADSSNYNNTVVLKIPLDNSVATNKNNKILVETKIKIPAQQSRSLTRGLFSLSDGDEINIFGLSYLTALGGLAVNADNRVDGAWTHKQNTTTNTDWEKNSEYNNVGSPDGTGGSDDSRKTFMSQNSASSDYYVYRWVIDTASNTFRFYYSKNDENNFKEPYGDLYMIDTSYGVDKTIRYTQPGIFPTGKLPNEINSLLIRTYCPQKNDSSEYLDTAYDIAYIKVEELPNEFSLKNGIYVSPNGNDDNIGTVDSPLKTIEDAVENFWICKNVYGYSPSIYLMSGEYTLEKSIKLSESYSGITFQNYNNSSVVVNGGYHKGNITKATEMDLNGKLNSELVKNGKIYKWDISECENLVLGDITEIAYQDPELIINDEIQTAARWPNSGYAYTTDPITKFDPESDDITNYVYEYEVGTTAELEKMTLDSARAKGYFSWNYRLTVAYVLGLGSSPNTIRLQTHGVLDSERWMNSNRRYYLYNIPEELDMPGEYYIDYENKDLYYYPKNENAHPQLSGLSDGMFTLSQNCDNVSFTGIEFKNIRGTFIDALLCDSLKINKCVFRNCGGRAVRTLKTYNSEITECGFFNIGDSAVELSGGDRLNLTPSNSSIKNCYFTNGGRMRTYAPFVQLGTVGIEGMNQSVGINVENNYFYDHKHTAIIYEGNDFIIKNNIFDKCGTEVQDAAGAIYARAYATYRGNEITNNIFRNIRSYKLSKDSTHIFAVYMDDLVAGTKIDNNLYYNCEEAFNLGGGQAHKFTDNMVYDCYRLGSYIHRGNNKSAVTAPDGYLYTDVKNMRDSGYDESKWFERYPDYKQFVEDLEIFNEDPDTTDAEKQGAVYIRDIDFTNNTMICENAQTSSKYIAESGSPIFATLKEYNDNYSPAYGVNWKDGSNYWSTDLNEVTISGTSIINNSSDDFNIPNVSNAGIISNPLGFPTGRDGNNDIVGENDVFFSGYRTEEFERYTNGTQITQTEELEMSGNTTINDGCVTLSNGESFTIKLPAAANKPLDLGLDMIGSVKITVDGSNKGELSSADFDIKELKIYPQSETNGISEITLTAMGQTQIRTIGVSCDMTGEVNQKYLSFDFEGVDVPTAAQEYSDNIYYYSVYGHSHLQLQEDENQNTALSFAVGNHSVYPNREDIAEFKFTPVKLKNTTLDIKFRIKCLSQDLTNSSEGKTSYSVLQYCMLPVGFNADEPSVSISVNKSNNYAMLKVDNIDGGLKIAGGNNNELVSEAAFKSDYIDIKITLDEKNKQMIYYVKENGIWTHKYTLNSVTFPDYIDRLQCRTKSDKYSINDSSDTNPGCEYLVDDIEVSQARHILFRTENNKYGDNEAELSEGMQVYVTPDYIAGGGKWNCIVTAIKNEDGVLERADVWQNSIVTIPNGKGKELEIYMFKDGGNLSPTRAKSIFTIK